MAEMPDIRALGDPGGKGRRKREGREKDPGGCHNWSTTRGPAEQGKWGEKKELKGGAPRGQIRFRTNGIKWRGE